MRSIWIFVALAFFLTGPMSGGVSAQQLNKRKHASPGQQAKINRALPQSRVNNNGKGVNSTRGGGAQRSCDLNVANTNIEKGQRAPREVVNVIRGDVIKVCR
jgi:hypothetical protein